MKKILLLAIAFCSINAFSQSIKNQVKDMVLTAKVNAGCLIQADDFNFGNLIAQNLLTKTHSVNGSINVHCSKGVNLSITQSGKINTNAAGGASNYLTLNNTGVANDSGTFFAYLMKISSIETNEKYTVLAKNSNHNLGVNLYNGQSYALEIKTKTNSAISLPITTEILPQNSAYGYKLIPGNYGDMVTYNIIY